MKEIAIVTGASSGMGREFAKTVKDNIDVDELWVIARRKESLEELKKEIDLPIKVLALDLSKEDSFEKIERLLQKEKKLIKLLVNASGYGKFEKTTNISTEDNIGMIKLNIEALTRMCLICLPFMKHGSKIINFASIAAFQPIPYINIYAATKSYVLNFSRALNVELEKDGINVMAICPFWTKTEFFNHAVTKNEIVKKYVAMYDPQKVVKKAWKDLNKKKEISVYGFNSHLQVMISKLFNHHFLMKMWLNQQKIK